MTESAPFPSGSPALHRLLALLADHATLIQQNYPLALRAHLQSTTALQTTLAILDD